VGPRAGLDRCEKSRPTGIRAPDRPVRSETLYRLSYPGTTIFGTSFNAVYCILYCIGSAVVTVKGMHWNRLLVPQLYNMVKYTHSVRVVLCWHVFVC
jgi:hypothetical protein